MNKLNISVLVVSVIALVVACASLLGGGEVRTVVERQLGASAGPDIYSDLRVHGNLTSGGRHYATTTTASTYTMVRAELAPYNVLEINPGANITITLPATSTMTDIVPDAGDVRDFFIRNASTTAATTITLAAGAGMDLQKNEDTADLAIAGLDWAKLTFIRQSSGDITVIMSEWIEAD